MAYGKYTKEEIEKIKDLWNKGKNTVEISKLVNRSQSGIEIFLKREGIYTKRLRNKITDKDIDNMVTLYSQGNSSTYIYNLYKDQVKCPETILRYLKNRGCKIRAGGTITQLKYEDFFENIDSEEKAYILGFLIADGCIHETKSSDAISLSLKDEDKYMLEQIKEIIGIGRKIVSSRGQNILSTCSNKMSKDLSKYGVVPRKTDKSYFPIIDKKFERHLVRGIFDGDGTAYFCKNRLIFGFYGTNLLVTQIRDLLCKELDLSPNKVFDKGTVSFVYFSKPQDVKNFYNYLYNDTTIFLKRKKAKFDYYLKENSEVS